MSNNPDWIELNYTVERIGRSEFGFSGLFHIKTDLYDDTKISGYIERSRLRNGPFIKLPMSFENVPLTNAMNTFYKDVAMPSIQNCSVNAPFFEDRFVAPLTARKIELNKCNFLTDNLPNVMMEGYYKLKIEIFGDYSAYVLSLVYIENNK